jgi:hypothetical protein
MLTEDLVDHTARDVELFPHPNVHDCISDAHDALTKLAEKDKILA